MPSGKRKAGLAGFIVIGCGLVAVGISTENYGLMSGGVVFILIGAAAVIRSRKSGDTTDDTTDDKSDS